MDPIMIGVLGILGLLILLFIGVPIAFAMAVVGIAGTTAVVGLPQAMSQISLIAWSQGTDFIIVCIPLFILMGQLTATTGIADDLYDCLQKWLGRKRGGLAVASVLACGGFGAVTGSSVASVATMGTIVYPEMKKYGYDTKLATGVLAASGTLGILIPPSIAFAFLGTLTDTSIAKLFIAGIIPGVLTIAVFSAIIWGMALVRPDVAPLGPKFSWSERLKSTWAVVPIGIIFLIVIGSLYGGIATPTEASGIGACGVFLVAMMMRRLSWKAIKDAVWETGVTSAFIYAIIIGGYLIARFLALTGFESFIIESVVGSGLGKYGFILLLVVLYFILGMMLDVFGMIILTVPFVFPIVLQLGIDPIWFGVFLVIMTEVALITPPVGVNVFVMKSVASDDVPLVDIFKGVLPFLVGEFVIIAALIVFPALATWLPGKM